MVFCHALWLLHSRIKKFTDNDITYIFQMEVIDVSSDQEYIGIW